MIPKWEVFLKSGGRGRSEGRRRGWSVRTADNKQLREDICN
jgi:hypothetical protein